MLKNHSDFLWNVRRDDKDSFLTQGALNKVPDRPQELADTSGEHKVSTPN